MTHAPSHPTETQPDSAYQPPFPKLWWTQKGFYTRYMIRELSSFFAGTYCAVIAVGLWRLSQGPAAWNGYLHALQSPLSIVYHVLALLFVLYHTVTWFAVTPRTMPILLSEDFLPHAPIVIAQYVAWFAVSLIILLAAAWL